jgi:membrane-bound ClpP family serine protease
VKEIRGGDVFMALLQQPSVGFLLIFMATLFLFGEMLVKAKGIFGFIGIGLMTVYFSYHLDLEQHLVWLSLLYVSGFLLILLDGKLINDGSVALIGSLLMIAALAIPSPSILYGVLVGMGFITGAAMSFLFLKAFPARNLWSKMALKDQLTSEKGYNSINPGYKSLVGKQGETQTPFRPTGTVNIDGNVYSAIAEGRWVKPGIPVKVVSVDGTRIVIEEITESSSEPGFGDENNQT